MTLAVLFYFPPIAATLRNSLTIPIATVHIDLTGNGRAIGFGSKSLEKLMAMTNAVLYWHWQVRNWPDSGHIAGMAKSIAFWGADQLSSISPASDAGDRSRSANLELSQQVVCHI